MSRFRVPGARRAPRAGARRATVEPLEPRILLSADLPGVPVEAALPPQHAPAPAADPAGVAPAPEVATAATGADAAPREVVFVDGGVEGYDELVDELLAGRSDAGAVDVVVLDPRRDGLAQIGEVLAAYDHELDAVHVVSHGSHRGIQLGDTWLTRESLAARGGSVSEWGRAFGQEADLLLYGCNLAGSADGRALVDTLAGLTGADVAASIDVTGSAPLGGDWELEYRSGRIEAAMALGPESRWHGALATVRDEFDTVAFDNNDGTQPWATDWEELGESTDPSSGLVRVESGALRIGASSESNITGRGAVRGADLSGATSATLSFDFRRSFSDSGGGAVLLEISNDGGSSWSPIETYDLVTNDPGFIPESFDVTPFISADTRIRFIGLGEVQENTFFRVDNVQIEFTNTNNAPVLSPTGPSLPALTEDQTGNLGALVSDLLGASVADVDAGAVEGIAVTALDPSNGAWEFSTNDGTTWTPVGAVSETSALLLRDTDRIRFVPDAQNADAASFTFRAWDRTVGTPGTLADTSTSGGTTPFSTATDTASVAVADVNDAPGLAPSGPSLPALTEDQTGTLGALVSDLLGASVTDVDAGAVEGIAVTALDPGNGAWEFSTNDGTTWTPVGAVSETNALLLRDTDRIRFVPDAQNADAASFTFRAWDRTAGTPGTLADTSTSGGTTPFSTATDTASVAVADVNDAPGLAPSGPSLPALTEDQTGTLGALVSDLLGASVTDVDAGAVEGIAVTALDPGNGAWEFSTNDGTTWTPVGAVSETNALLLRDTDRIRFVPDAQNADAASFTFRAWDRTAGTPGTQADTSTSGGTTPFSTATDTASVAVTDVNDAPGLGNALLPSVSENATDPAGATVSSLFAVAFSDVDAGASLAGVAVVGNGGDPAAQGEWQYSSDGGATWLAVGPVEDGGGALALDASARVRFVPAAEFSGAPPPLVVRALDDSYGGGFSSAGGGAEVRVNVDTSAPGGTTAISGGTAQLSTSVAAVAPGGGDPSPDRPGETAPEIRPGDILPGALDPEPEPDPTRPARPAADEGVEDGSRDGSEREPDPDEEPRSTEAPAEASTAPTGVIPLADTSLGTLADAPERTEAGTSEAPAPETIEARQAPRHAVEADEPLAERGMQIVRDLLSGVAGTELRDLIFVGQPEEFLSELDGLREEAEARAVLETRFVGSTLAVTTGMSVGYVIWLTRGGVLLASLLSSMPAWRLVDPIPILARLRAEDEEDPGDEESLDSMVRGGSRRVPPPERGGAGPGEERDP